MTDKYIQKLDHELELQIELINRLEPGEERAKEIKNLETMNAIRTDILQKQTENYAAEMKVEQDDRRILQEQEKIAADKKQSKVGMITNGVMVGFTAISTIGTPLLIMNAERLGQFWSNRALNATEKPPKIGFIRLPSFRK